MGKVLDLERLAGDSVSNFRSTTWLFLSFACVALVLATIGATGGSIVRMILVRRLRVTLLGLIPGLARLAHRSYSQPAIGVGSGFTIGSASPESPAPARPW